MKPTKSQLRRQVLSFQEEIAGLRTRQDNLEERTGRQQDTLQNLAAGILGTLRRSAGISTSAHGILERMNLFDRRFTTASADLVRIDQEVDHLVVQVKETEAAVAQTTSAVEQISESLVGISEESTTRAEELGKLATLAVEGQREMQATEAFIRGVTARVDDLRNLQEVLDDIAAKTSILSMNAAIQAAHAGAAGKGFAVVADEVRRLAESSATNVQSIGAQLNLLIAAIHEAETSSKKTGQILSAVETQATRVNEGFAEIDHGVRELSVGASQVFQGAMTLQAASQRSMEAGRAIRERSGEITRTVGDLTREASAIETELTGVRGRSAGINEGGLGLSASAIALLAGHDAGGPGLSPVRKAKLSLQHLAWTSRVRAVLDGTLVLEADQVVGPHDCEFGKWLDSEGQAHYAAQAGFRTLIDRHEKLHQVARALVQAFNTGRPAEAEQGFPELVSLSEAVVEELERLGGPPGP